MIRCISLHWFTLKRKVTTTSRVTPSVFPHFFGAIRHWHTPCSTVIPKEANHQGANHAILQGTARSNSANFNSPDWIFIHSKSTVQKISNSGLSDSLKFWIMEICLCLIMTGEAFFSLSSYINKQSFCYWAEASPRHTHQCPLCLFGHAAMPHSFFASQYATALTSKFHGSFATTAEHIASCKICNRSVILRSPQGMVWGCLDSRDTSVVIATRQG